jgi:hypothetical protein
MHGFLAILLIIAMLATLVVLGLGVVSMLRGGGGNPPGERSNRLMRYRVLLQFVAIALFALIMLLGRR